jgi:hypothetical protein
MVVSVILEPVQALNRGTPPAGDKTACSLEDLASGAVTGAKKKS